MQTALANILQLRGKLEMSRILAIPQWLAHLLLSATRIIKEVLGLSPLLAMLTKLVLEQVLMGAVFLTITPMSSTLKLKPSLWELSTPT